MNILPDPLSVGTQAKREEGPVRLCYLILAHRYPHQLLRLVNRLDGAHTAFLVHLDRKAPEATSIWLKQQLHQRDNVHFLKRHTCHWGGFGIVRATLEGMQYGISEDIPFDHLVLLSGQDYPIKSNIDIREFFKTHEGVSFIHHNPFPYAEWVREDGGWDRVRRWHFRRGYLHVRLPVRNGLLSRVPGWRRFPQGYHPFGGAQFWCMARHHVRQVCDLVSSEPEFVSFFRFADIPDEIFLQTIAGNRLARDELRSETLTFVEWHRPGATLTIGDFGNLRRTDHLFARKFDLTVDSAVLDRIDREFLGWEKR